MSKKLLALVLALLLLLCLPLPALATEPAPDPGDAAIDEWLYPNDEDAAEEDDQLTDEEAQLAEVGKDGVEPSDGLETEDEDDLLGAMEVYSWFALEPLDVDESLPSPDGTMWRVLDDRFNTKELLLDMLHFYFSEEIVNELWNSSTNPYTEINGYLYTTGEGREMDERIGETEVSVLSKTDSKVELNVLVHYLEPDEYGTTDESFHYTRELKNDEWQYSEFPFFW